MRHSTLKFCIFALILLPGSIVRGFFLMKRSKKPRTENVSIQKFLVKPKLFFHKTRVPPTIKMTKIGETVTLRCDAVGSPPPTIHWLFKGQRIHQATKGHSSDDFAAYEDAFDKNHVPLLRASSTASELTIPCIRPNDEGTYSCIIENSYRRDYKHTTVIVENTGLLPGADQCADNSDKTDLQPVQIYMWTKNRLEINGHSVQFFCRASGYPRPKISWFGKDRIKIVSDDQKYTILSNGDLLIRNIQWSSDMGTYTCEADNGLDADSKTMFLYPTYRKKDSK